jgi:hypothetical protein
VDQAGLRLIQGHLSPVEVPADPLVFQAGCVEAFVASWTARGFADSTIDNDTGVLERMLTALGRPAWDVTAEDGDRVVGGLASAGRADARTRISPSGSSAGLITTAVCEPLCGSTPIITATIRILQVAFIGKQRTWRAFMPAALPYRAGNAGCPLVDRLGG